MACQCQKILISKNWQIHGTPCMWNGGSACCTHVKAMWLHALQCFCWQNLKNFQWAILNRSKLLMTTGARKNLQNHWFHLNFTFTWPSFALHQNPKCWIHAWEESVHYFDGGNFKFNFSPLAKSYVLHCQFDIIVFAFMQFQMWNAFAFTKGDKPNSKILWM